MLGIVNRKVEHGMHTRMAKIGQGRENAKLFLREHPEIARRDRT